VKPDGSQARNFRIAGHGQHHYGFHLYALDEPIPDTPKLGSIATVLRRAHGISAQPPTSRASGPAALRSSGSRPDFSRSAPAPSRWPLW